MKITILGCWAPYPRAGGACSGYLLQEGGMNILLDCGNGVISNLQKHIDFRQLDAVIISHFHPDHYMDLFCLRHAVEGAIRDGSRHEPVPLYVPGTPEPVHRQFFDYAKAFRIQKISAGRTLEIGEITISFIKTVHKLEAYGVLARGKGLFGYTADTAYQPQLKEFFTGSDLLLSEASLLEKDKAYAETGHLTVRQAARLGRDTGSAQLVISHFWPEYDLAEVYAEAKEIFGSVKLASEGDTYLL